MRIILPFFIHGGKAHTSAGSRRLRVIVGAMLLVVLTAVLAAGRDAFRAAPFVDPDLKQPATQTAGPTSAAYAPTAAEVAKSLHPLRDEATADAALDPRHLPYATVGPPRAGHALNAVELAKLAMLRNAGAPPGDKTSASTWRSPLEAKLKPVPIVIQQPRPRGAEGLTPEEQRKHGGERP